MASDALHSPGVTFSGTFSSPEPPADAQIRRFKDVGLFVVSSLILLTLVGFSLFMLLATCTADDSHQWALSTLTTVFGGVLGWLIKR
ncbi:hypothetical protein ACQ86G_02660 [Roseateles chitinivorans]|uniref:hypothetical protein n=1 Tax=Roseateles chitinivorans TaxID=2917965 RepID=UPI003D66D1AC